MSHLTQSGNPTPSASFSQASNGSHARNCTPENGRTNGVGGGGGEGWANSDSFELKINSCLTRTHEK